MSTSPLLTLKLNHDFSQEIGVQTTVN